MGGYPAGAIAEPREAFTADWIADGGRAYVSRYALDPVHAIRLVRGAGGATVLAHPRAGRQWELSDEQIAGLAAAGLAGVEVFHPDHTAAQRTRLLTLVSGLGLLASGGSDDHGSFDPFWTAVIALFGVLALAASVYLVEVLEIFKLRQTRLRQLVTLRRQVGAPEPQPDEVERAVETELETGTFPTVDPETGEFEAIDR